MSSPARFLLFVLLAIVGVKLSEQVYTLVAHRDERALARELQARLLDSGAELTALRLRADSLRRVIQAEDRMLEDELRTVRRFHRSARQGVLGASEYERYGTEVARYNHRLEERNGVSRELEEMRSRLLRANASYNAVADSLHTLAVRMNRPYYQVPTALEAAEERRRAAP
jgi:predicted RNase H-like nuclease (RuvC/YqgF family)